MPWQADLFRSSEKPLAENETQRKISLGDRIVPYVLRRTRRRTIGLSIDQRGLRVGAPPRASLNEVESLIHCHGDWVIRKLDEWQIRLRPVRLAIVDGVRVPMLGKNLQIHIATGNNRAVWNEVADPVLTLCLRSPKDAAPQLEKALREKARRLFSQRLQHFAARLDVPSPPLALSSARTRWGSCNLKTGIRLNWRLIHFSEDIIDYVVAHELAHLREMNHSARFWRIVEQLCPDGRRARAELKALAGAVPHW